MLSFSCDDDSLNEIYSAAVQTFRQNSVDIFADCPSRERGGWLCDSYFPHKLLRKFQVTL
ncbi:MAG: alpha-L-rhamnosidase-related protein [Ignavibacteriaceae bacterium]